MRENASVMRCSRLSGTGPRSRSFIVFPSSIESVAFTRLEGDQMVHRVWKSDEG